MRRLNLIGCSHQHSRMRPFPSVLLHDRLCYTDPSALLRRFEHAKTLLASGGLFLSIAIFEQCSIFPSNLYLWCEFIQHPPNSVSAALLASDLLSNVLVPPGLRLQAMQKAGTSPTLFAAATLVKPRFVTALCRFPPTSIYVAATGTSCFLSMNC